MPPPHTLISISFYQEYLLHTNPVTGYMFGAAALIVRGMAWSAGQTLPALIQQSISREAEAPT